MRITMILIRNSYYASFVLSLQVALFNLSLMTSKGYFIKSMNPLQKITND